MSVVVVSPKARTSQTPSPSVGKAAQSSIQSRETDHENALVKMQAGIKILQERKQEERYSGADGK